MKLTKKKLNGLGDNYLKIILKVKKKTGEKTYLLPPPSHPPPHSHLQLINIIKNERSQSDQSVPEKK